VGEGVKKSLFRAVAGFLGLASLLPRNSKVSMLNTPQSPRYHTVFAAFDVNGGGIPFSDRVGNIGRNTYRGRSLLHHRLAFAESVQFGRAGQARSHAEVLNLFNSPNVNGIDTVYGAAEFLGLIPQNFGDHVSSHANPTFDTPNVVTPARQVQLAMWLNF
jgi:hypothetical protein